MPGKRYSIQLLTEERERLNQLVRGGRHSARVVTRARILLKIDEGWKAPRIAAAPVSSTGQALIALACSPAPEGHDHWTLSA